MSVAVVEARYLERGHYLPEYEETVADVVQLEDFVVVAFANDHTVKLLHETDKVEVWE
ncbi:hypothetical protein [Mycobacteroides chelonae]|uniref:hypothetical protein n=1 Tax=Mycobacteroides chelonae TaxID=1774 RepID=UPI0013F4E539|nr:hypothetical protein [Mycobacteroides chelonae]